MTKQAPMYRVMGAPSPDTPGYVLSYCRTLRGALRMVTIHRRAHTTVWIQARQDNGEWW